MRCYQKQCIKGAVGGSGADGLHSDQCCDEKVSWKSQIPGQLRVLQVERQRLYYTITAFNMWQKVNKNFVSNWFWADAHLESLYYISRLSPYHSGPDSCLYPLPLPPPFLSLLSNHKIKESGKKCLKKKVRRPWFKMLYHIKITFGWPKLPALGMPVLWPEHNIGRKVVPADSLMPSPGWFLQWWYHCFHCIKTWTTGS